jgi:putative transposase
MVGMSRDVYNAARQRLRELRRDSSNPEAVFEAYRQIMTDVEVAKRSNKLRRRRYAAQMELDKEGRQRDVKPAENESPPAAQSILFAFEPAPPTLEIRPRTLPVIPGDRS